MKYEIWAPDSGRPTESNRQPAGRSLEPRFYIVYTFTLYFIFLILFIIYIYIYIFIYTIILNFLLKEL